jgi:Protein of unknown function (DUF2934)
MARAKLASISKRKKDESVVNNAAEASKLQAIKADSQTSVLPINLEEEIRRRAYELSQHRGFAGGHETEDWLQAETEVRQRYRQ